ncbi:MAG: S1 RNA-binding domain-containing protein [Thermodesulfovibrionales bacterium]
MKRSIEKKDTLVEDMFSGKQVSVFREGQAVDLVIGNGTTLGYKAVINDSAEGMLYKNEIFQTLRRGQHITGYIKKLRDDGKIDLCLQKPGPEKIDELSEKILAALKEHGGFIALTDKSPSQSIYSMFGMSKKTYKKAVGGLYKKRLILIGSDGIRLSSPDPSEVSGPAGKDPQ